MNECMDFPNTFKEFIDEYSFKDREEVYTNGSELIQTFRVMQGYEHFIAEHDKQIRDEVIDCITEKYYDVIESVLHNREKEIKLKQALSIYAKIMNGCNKIAEQMKGEQNE